ncbi:669_t:CDS:2 [Ambispora gerdemannii]|uniref:669_t:CDS:1 n=1 Tax=Ambispora gerdemannii TaxID=144530 RepID=A0A9N8VS78_9GLOM|nr:669_t:CDS:2 [Ambispora gerdemannii]
MNGIIKSICKLLPIYEINIIPEKLVEVEVKKEDFMKGFAQASVQMESSLTGRKRKADEIDSEQGVDKDEEPTFKLSEPVTVVYKSDNMQIMVEEVLGHIVWLLEAQRPVEASQGGEQSRVLKKA